MNQDRIQTAKSPSEQLAHYRGKRKDLAGRRCTPTAEGTKGPPDQSSHVGQHSSKSEGLATILELKVWLRKRLLKSRVPNAAQERAVREICLELAEAYGLELLPTQEGEGWQLNDPRQEDC